MNCETCKKEFEPNDTIFTINGQEVCYDCAQAAAKKAIEEEREIEILDQNFEEHFLCVLVRRPFPQKRTPQGGEHGLPLRHLHSSDPLKGRKADDRILSLPTEPLKTGLFFVSFAIIKSQVKIQK